MSCCSDVMKPIEASSSCTRKMRRHMPRKRCVIQAAAGQPELRIANPSNRSASSQSAMCVAAWRLMTGAIPT